jgi:hypothetical protein
VKPEASYGDMARVKKVIQLNTCRETMEYNLICDIELVNYFFQTR